MRFGIDLPTTGDYADVRLLADLAGQAEAAGWDGFFVYDQVASEAPEPLADPWIALTAIALSTRRIRFGPLITPLPRRRPWKLAREAATLDHLSGGRMILGVGLGSSPAELDDLGEAADPRERAAQLDEGLGIVAGLWSGQPFSHQGDHYAVREAHFLPAPVQAPRIPIWVAGIWPNRAPFRRAARWDGAFPHFAGGMMPAEELAQAAAYIREHRSSAGPFDLVIRNKQPEPNPAEDPAALARYAAAGLTWWLEGVETNPDPEALRARIRRGPPGTTT